MSTGVLYVAIGEHWCRVASESAALVKRYMPSLPITLFADRAWNDDCFDEVRVMEAGGNPLLTKTLWMAESPYERTLFCDTDITLCDGINDILTLCDRFDLAVPHAPYRLANMGLEAPLPEFLAAGMPDCFPGMNTGLLVYNRSARVSAFFKTWCEYHQQHCSITPHAPSQPAFRTALYRSDLRFAIIPDEYHCRFVFPFKVSGRVKVLHGRHPDMNLVIRRVNQSSLPRVGVGYLVESAQHSRQPRGLRRLLRSAGSIVQRAASRLRRGLFPLAHRPGEPTRLLSAAGPSPKEIPNGGIVSLM